MLAWRNFQAVESVKADLSSLITLILLVVGSICVIKKSRFLISGEFFF